MTQEKLTNHDQIRRCRFEDYYTTYFPRLVGFCYNKLGDRNLAEDLAQTAFVRFLEKYSPIPDGANVAGLLYRITQRLVIDTGRRRNVVSFEYLNDGENPLIGYEAPEDVVLQAETVREVGYIFSLQPPRYQQALRQWCSGYSSDQIAQAHGFKKREAAKTLVHRAKRKFARDWRIKHGLLPDS